MIGDVCGHGPDEAALGVELRIAWRTLTLAGVSGSRLLGILQQVLECERPTDEIFATVCAVDIAPDGRVATAYLAGHPPPLLLRDGHPAEPLAEERRRPGPGAVAARQMGATAHRPGRTNGLCCSTRTG